MEGLVEGSESYYKNVSSPKINSFDIRTNKLRIEAQAFLPKAQARALSETEKPTCFFSRLARLESSGHSDDRLSGLGVVQHLDEHGLLLLAVPDALHRLHLPLPLAPQALGHPDKPLDQAPDRRKKSKTLKS